MPIQGQQMSIQVHGQKVMIRHQQVSRYEVTTSQLLMDGSEQMLILG